MKNNKSPGIDGISAEFLKVFWGQLKFFVQNTINCSYEKGQLSVSLRKTIITCLPKGNKDRKFIKNWRPIFLLCVVYKLASSVIAARLKPLLEHIISSSQSGFLKGRHMGECTRLIYDIMYHTEKKNIPGVLMSVDFKKAFDSVSWKFLYKTLNYFGFNEKFISWIQLFNTNVNAYVLQSGFLSNPIAIQRGCRQGDPIVLYLFLIVAEILTLFIENEPKIKEIQIGKTMSKLPQYADDTTSSLQATLNILEIFGSLSGLNVNCDKTKLIWIGSKKDSKEKLNVTSRLHWGDSQFTLLGLEISTNLSNMAKRVLNSWRFRYLTAFGKITILKTLILSQFNHLFTSFVYLFIWSFTSLSTLYRSYHDG